jgi:EF hand
MRPVDKLAGITLAIITAFVMPYEMTAQPPREKAPEQPKDKPKDYTTSPIYTRMMAFDKNKDGKLTKDEITDPRMMRLFEMADTNKDGVVTKEELLALAAKLDAEGGEPGRGPGDRGPGDRGPGDRGPGDRGPGDRGPGGPGGPGGRFGPPQPGVILAPMLQDRLQLTEQQKKQLADLQKEVDGKLDKILTEEQKTELKRMREGPPGRPGEGGPGRPPEGRPGEGRPNPGRGDR